MGYKTCIKGKAVKLSNNFNSTEFDCHGSGCCSKTIINESLVDYLQKIREHFGKPVRVTSGYRCPSHNSSIGGAQRSQHRAGNAADIVVQDVTPREVAKYAESIGILGIGLYESNADGYFVHIDTRAVKTFWYGQKEAYRSTFGGSVNNTTTGTKSSVLVRGSSGDKVKELQKKLISLGYSCGSRGADGDFGASTEYAVRRFQNEYGGIGIDGKVGKVTSSAIDIAVKAKAYRVEITANVLNVHSGVGTNYKIVSTVKRGTICLILEEKNGWGKISRGWIKSTYYKKL